VNKRKEIMKEQGKWEEAVRSKVQDYKAKAPPGSWEAVARRLPSTRRATLLLHAWRYAAAVALLLLASLAGYLYYGGTDERPAAGNAVVEQRRTHRPESVTAAGSHATGAAAAEAAMPVRGDAPKKKAEKPLPAEGATTAPATAEKTAERPEVEETERTEPDGETEAVEAGGRPEAPATLEGAQGLRADAEPVQKQKRRRWSFGAGGGSWSATGDGTGGGSPMLASAPLSDANTIVYNAETVSLRHARRNLAHKFPLSAGAGVSYALDDRWALSSGVTYTLLRSEGIVFSGDPGETRQRLHFIGVPLGVNCTLAKWQRFRVYASAHVMGECNVAGYLHTDYYRNGVKIRTESDRLRMKEWLWSTGVNAGVSYPLIRCVNAYVEGGATRYFDNGSAVETIRSDRPFQLSLQAGIRFGL
jgi:opacity protein-like surface antigen